MTADDDAFDGGEAGKKEKRRKKTLPPYLSSSKEPLLPLPEQDVPRPPRLGRHPRPARPALLLVLLPPLLLLELEVREPPGP